MEKRTATVRHAIDWLLQESGGGRGAVDFAEQLCWTVLRRHNQITDLVWLSSGGLVDVERLQDFM